MTPETKAIQMVDLQSQSVYFESKLSEYWNDIIQNSAFIKGKYVSKLESELSNYLNPDLETITCGNGTDALTIALEALNIPKNTYILTSPFSFISAAEVIKRYGCTPVYLDISPNTYQMDYSQLNQLNEINISAVIGVHLFGQTDQLEALLEFCAVRNIPLIEDNAQSFGAFTSINGKQQKLGTIGTISTTSFFPSKNLGCYGDGGAIFTSDPILADRCRTIANHGSKQKYSYELIGLNSRLDNLQAAVLLAKLPHLNKFNERRRNAARLYSQELNLLEHVTCPYEATNSFHIYHQYCIQVERRDALKEYLASKNIPSMIYYPKSIPEFELYQNQIQSINDFPNSIKVTQNVLGLPMHSELSAEEIQYICKSIKEFYIQ